MKTRQTTNGIGIAISKAPVMYRLLEDSGEPTKKQASGKRIRLRAALKRENRPEEPAIGTVA